MKWKNFLNTSPNIILLNQERKVLEERVKDSQHEIQNLHDNHEYLTCKNKFDAIYDDIANGIKVKIHCDQFEHDEKSSNF